MARVLDIEIIRGESINIDLTVTDDGTSEGTPVDITGWTFELTIRRQRDETDSATVLLTTSGVIQDAAAGEYRYTLTAAETLALPVTRMHEAIWDSWRTNSGSEKPLTVGTCTIKQEAGGRA